MMIMIMMMMMMIIIVIKRSAGTQAKYKQSVYRKKQKSKGAGFIKSDERI